MDDLTELLAKATPGPWVTAESTIHGVKYGGMWVQGADIEDDDGQLRAPLVRLSGSGGAISYTKEIVERQNHDDNDANATLIALAPTLATEVIELREARAKLLKAADYAAAVIDAIYEQLERVEKAGGATSISGVAACHTMITSLRKSAGRTETLVMEPLRKAISEATQ